jgi:hypothetical protein
MPYAPQGVKEPDDDDDDDDDATDRQMCSNSHNFNIITLTGHCLVHARSV